MKNKKIIFFSNIYNPYQKDFLNAVSKKITIKAIFNDKNTFNSPWNIKKNNHIKDISSYDYVNRKNYYKKLLKNFNPNIILVGGYNLRDIFTILLLLKKKNYKLFFFLEMPKNNILIGLFLKKIYLYFFFKFFNCNGIFAVGKNAQKYYSKFNKHVFNLPYSVNENLYKQNNFKKNKYLKFVFVGQLIERKGIDLIIAAFKKLNNSVMKDRFELNIIGDGPQKKLIQNLSKKIKNLNYYGFISPEKLPSIIRQNHILILPSRSEGWGVVVNEAMACGLALILGANMEITKDFFIDNINGKIVKNTSDSLYDKMKYMIKNTKKVKQMGKKNYKLFKYSKLNSKISSKFFINRI
jgi:glycosyltransferase involved in cell wall biosynthesis